MHTPLAYVFDTLITPWKVIGYLGVLLFAGRWVVQLIATRREGEPAFPTLFWTMSIVGSGCLLAYFIWGKNDSVGVLSNLFPMGVALYNFTMHQRAASRRATNARKRYDQVVGSNRCCGSSSFPRRREPRLQ